MPLANMGSKASSSKRSGSSSKRLIGKRTDETKEESTSKSSSVNQSVIRSCSNCNSSSLNKILSRKWSGTKTELWGICKTATFLIVAYTCSTYWVFKPYRCIASNNSRTYSGFSGKLFSADRSEEHTSELQSRPHLVCRL